MTTTLGRLIEEKMKHNEIKMIFVFEGQKLCQNANAWHFFINRTSGWFWIISLLPTFSQHEGK